jgi:putative RNA 2'-phosphotransferase
MNRQHVHLSADDVTAKQVGSRHGKPVILFIDTARMHEEGFPFYLSENQVWLTDRVPAKYISIT